MTLTELCALFDKHDIVETQAQIDKEYYATLENIYTDGKYKTNITRDAYVHITSVHDATYLIFVDLENNIYLRIYRYTPDTNYKLIKQKLQFLKKTINRINKSDSQDVVENDIINEYVDDDVIDINTFTCTECESKDKLVFRRSKTNPEALKTTCATCRTEYVFVPSKYYKLSSKRTIYYKSEKSSRQIEIEDIIESKSVTKKEEMQSVSIPQYLDQRTTK